MCLISLVIIVVGVALGYFRGLTLFRNTLVEDYEKMALILSDWVSQMLSEETLKTPEYLSISLIRDTIIAINKQYNGVKKMPYAPIPWLWTTNGWMRLITAL